MAEDSGSTSQSTTGAGKDEDKKNVRRREGVGNVKIRGRISTTSLRAGEEATVKRTDAVNNLLARGYVEEVK